MENEKFEFWCLVELFGHQRIAGKCTEQNIAGTNMLRVDVPANEKYPAFTKFYGSSAIYAINPMDEETVTLLADNISAGPINVWDINKLLKDRKNLLTNEVPSSGEDDDDHFM